MDSKTQNLINAAKQGVEALNSCQSDFPFGTDDAGDTVFGYHFDEDSVNAAIQALKKALTDLGAKDI